MGFPILPYLNDSQFSVALWQIYFELAGMRSVPM